MNDPSRAAEIGLERLLPLLEDRWGQSIEILPERNVLGPVAHAGSSQPLPSSAACLRVGPHTVWLPAPEEAVGPAPLYRHAGQMFAMPIIRLFLSSRAPTPAEAKPVKHLVPEYLTLSHWVLDAFTRWLFPGKRTSPPPGMTDDRRSTILECLRELRPNPRRDLDVLAQVVRYAVFGSAGFFRLIGLVFPPCPMWLRPIGSTPLARAAARALVVTARLDLGSAPARAAVPNTDIRAAEYRIQPARASEQGICPDWGVDPVHTPEGADIRMTGRLGVGVQVEDSRRLKVPQGDAAPLSASTARLPFAGYNDPRRLLLAANMQLQAVPLSAQELPLVRQDANGTDPPGVNLRVAYLAWQGLNHEDAWVLSESAAAKLSTQREVVYTISIRAIELAAELLVEPGQDVERGALLVKRRVAPMLLSNSLQNLAKFAGLDDARAAFDGALLARFARMDEDVQLEPEIGDRAREAGRVTRIDTWDLLDPDGVPGTAVIPETLCGAYRTVYRVAILRELPLAVGDKLANRHGHKGVVGAILPDQAMPRWDDQPLEALLDPVSVLNRSNWGQVYETLGGAVALRHVALEVGKLSGEEVLRRAIAQGANERGQWDIQPSEVSGWLTMPVQAVAGVQFLMRLPHHAADKISGSPLPPQHLAGNLRRRAQRFGEMDHWALWAHGLTAPSRGSAQLSPGTERLRRLLATAGFALDLENGCLSMRSLALDAKPPAGVKQLQPTEGRQSEIFSVLEQVRTAPPTVLVFDPPVQAVSVLGEDSESKEQRETIAVRWLPVLPAGDRPEHIRPDGSRETHELTRALRQVIRAARDRGSALSIGADANEESERLSDAVHDLMRHARAFAVGLRATGPLSNKLAFLRRGVLGRRLAHSGRATATPAGPLGLDLDEVGMPPALARALLGPHLADDALAARLQGRRFWLKRDPVLHRWGLLLVRGRLTAGDTIRLPSSLLGPLGADFDGDTVAVFASLPGDPNATQTCSPSAQACDYSVGGQGRALFLPSKQYRYGLLKLTENSERMEAFRQSLAAAGAPDWPLDGGLGTCLNSWVRSASAAHPEDGHWWAILEEHALKALADDPVMTFGLPHDAGELAELPVIRCGAAKDLCMDDHGRCLMERILAGKSLDIYQRCRDAGSPARSDPIHDVMVAARDAIGRFGGALRRLVYAANPLDSRGLCDAQCLTERATQKALSVKAGKPPIAIADYERQLRRLLDGKPWERADASDLQELLQSMDPVWERLRRLMPAEPVAWLEWLIKPHELARLLRRQPDQIIRLPLDDLRLQCWLDQVEPAAR